MHALSSFQRTGRRPPLSRPGPLEPFSREPSDVTSSGTPCQPLSCRLTSFPEPAPIQPRFGEPYECTKPTSPCQPLFRTRANSSWATAGLASGGDKKCSERSGASGHRGHDGSRPRQRINIRPPRATVNSAKPRRGQKYEVRSTKSEARSAETKPGESHGRRPPHARRLARRTSHFVLRTWRQPQPSCLTLTTCRFRWPFRSTNRRPSMACATVTRPRSSVTRPSFR